MVGSNRRGTRIVRISSRVKNICRKSVGPCFECVDVKRSFETVCAHTADAYCAPPRRFVLVGGKFTSAVLSRRFGILFLRRQIVSKKFNVK